MSNNQALALIATQQVFFDVADLLNGSSYQELGYANRKEFLSEQKERLAEVEARIFKMLQEN